MKIFNITVTTMEGLAPRWALTCFAKHTSSSLVTAEHNFQSRDKKSISQKSEKSSEKKSLLLSLSQYG